MGRARAGPWGVLGSAPLKRGSGVGVEAERSPRGFRRFPAPERSARPVWPIGDGVKLSGGEGDVASRAFAPLLLGWRGPQRLPLLPRVREDVKPPRGG